jgi:hypothetical protein
MRRRLTVAVVGALVLMTGSQQAGSSQPTAPRPPDGCGPTWEIVPTGTDGILQGVSALSSTDAWAAGLVTTFDGLIHIRPVYLRWDGVSWTSYPNNTTMDGTPISDVVAIATDDAWAVGGQTIPYVEHWDGVSWSEVTVPNLGTFSHFSAVSATGPDDVWAVGIYWNLTGAAHTLVDHWDGVAWSVVPSPNLGSDSNGLGDVLAFSPTDAWATGSASNDMTGVSRAFTLHWDGTTWSLARVRTPLENNEELTAIAGNTSGDLFLAGEVRSTEVTNYAKRWDGSSWQFVGTANPTHLNWIHDAAAGSAGEEWIVGHLESGFSVDHTFVQHSFHGPFRRQDSPDVPGADGQQLLGVIVSPDDDVWAVGYSKTGGDPEETLVEHLCP